MGRARTNPEEAAVEIVGKETQNGVGDTKTKVKQKICKSGIRKKASL